MRVYVDVLSFYLFMQDSDITSLPEASCNELTNAETLAFEPLEYG